MKALAVLILTLIIVPTALPQPTYISNAALRRITTRAQQFIKLPTHMIEVAKPLRGAKVDQ
jgi:hypothetical protein